MRAWEEIRGKDRFTFVETGPAMVVIPVRGNKKSGLELMLIKEERLSGKTVLKAVGRYLRGLKPQEGATVALLKKAGVATSNLHCVCEKMTGFDTVILPISLCLGYNWKVITKGTAQRAILGLDEAIDKCLLGEMGDQATEDLIFRIFFLCRDNRLPLSYPRFKGSQWSA